MRENRQLIVGLLIGTLLGVGVTSLLLFPAAAADTPVSPLWAGLIAVILVVGAILISARSAAGKMPQTSFLVRPILAGVAIIVFATISVVLIYQQRALAESRARYGEASLREQERLRETKRKTGLLPVMANLLDQVDAELAMPGSRHLSDELIAQIAALSEAFEPRGFEYLLSDSTSVERRSSNERGLLLQSLVHRNIDPVSFARICRVVPFSGADLSGADLRGADLGEIDLMCANMRDSKLKGVNLREADLRGAALWGASADSATLHGAQLNRADLRWVALNNANLDSADLKDADLRHAKLRNASLVNADIQWADLGGAICKGATFQGADLFGASMTRTLLSNCLLDSTDLRRSVLVGADLTGASLRGALLNKAVIHSIEWFSQLAQWEVADLSKIRSNYAIAKSETGSSRYEIQEVRTEEDK